MKAKPGLSSIALVALALMLSQLLAAPAGAAVDESKRLAAYFFSPDDAPAAAVRSTLEKAAAEDKLALLVFGAEWCHDSRAFASQLSSPAMQAIIDDSYAVRFIDLGFLDDHRALLQPLGYPINFGTPTALIIDPESGQLLNYESVATWQNAALVPLGDYTSQFGGLADAWRQGLGDGFSVEASAALQGFEARQVERLAKGYAQLGPLLRRYAEKTLDDRAGFDALWIEVRDFRGALQQDLVRLHNSERVSGEPAGNFPTYGPFSWEQQQP